MDEPVLSPRIVRRGMNLSILSAVLLSLFTAVSTSAIFTGLLRSIHLTNPQIGIVMSLPLLFPPMQIIGAYLQRRSFHRKRFWLFCSVTTYTLYLALTALVTVWVPAARRGGLRAVRLALRADPDLYAAAGLDQPLLAGRTRAAPRKRLLLEPPHRIRRNHHHDRRRRARQARGPARP